MRVRRRVIVALATLTVLGSTVALATAGPAQASSRAKRPSAPVFKSKSTVTVAAGAVSYTIKTKATPVAAISAVGTLPSGLSLVDQGNGTATLSGTEAHGAVFTIGLQATNSVATTDQTLTLKVEGLPEVRHVFVITLENEGYDATFGDPSVDPYLATTLPSQGILLKKYYGIGHYSNDNYVAMISGQPPNSDNQLDCAASGFADFPAGDGLVDGIQQGAGCEYPADVPTLPGQLDAAGYTWKGYMEDMGNDPTRESATCGYAGDNQPDNTLFAESGDGYAARHDPFVYFHSITDDSAECNSNVVPLGATDGTLPAGTPAGVTGLATDLQSVDTTPNYSFITPNLCDDGHDYPCKNETSPSTSAVADQNAFLQTWVPLIEASPAFRQDGLLIVTFDESDLSDSRACCGETVGPAADAGGNGQSGPGGGLIGTVMVSPFITPGSKDSTPLNHYSMLASIEDLFGFPRIGEAATVTSTFDTGVFSTTAK